jgi:hypothetical protein
VYRYTKLNLTGAVVVKVKKKKRKAIPVAGHEGP